jgi:hypothetical protein
MSPQAVIRRRHPARKRPFFFRTVVGFHGFEPNDAASMVVIAP